MLTQYACTRVRLPSKPAHEPSNGPKLPVRAVCAIVLKKLCLYEYNNPSRGGTSPHIRFCFPVEIVVPKNTPKITKTVFKGSKIL